MTTRAVDAEAASRLATRILFKAERTLRAYPPNNEISCRVLEELYPALNHALPLELEVRNGELLCNGVSASEGSPVAPESASALWRDGIRRILISQGIDEDEVRRLVLALATPLSPDDPSEDYVTLLWSAQLPHVEVTAVDPYLSSEPLGDVVEGVPDREPETAAPPLADAPLAPARAEAFAIEPADLEALAREVGQEAAEPPWARFVMVLMQALTDPAVADRAADLGQAFEATVHRLVLAGHVPLAARLVRLAAGSALPESVATLVADARRRAGEVERLAPLEALIEEQRCPPRVAVAYLVALHPGVIPGVCQLLARARSDEARRAYVEVLTELGDASLPAVIEGLTGPRDEPRVWFARTLGRLRNPRATAPLLRALAGSSPELRHAIVGALSAIQGREALEALLRMALDDGDVVIRKLALRGLGTARTRLESTRLLARLRSNLLATLDEEEKDLLFQALGTVGDDGAVTYLSRLLRPTLPGLRRYGDWKRAADALARLGTPAAHAVLTRFSRSWRRPVADLCANALRVMAPPR